MDRQQVLWTIGGSFGGGIVVTILAHHFANIRGKRDAHRKASDKALSEVEKSLIEFRDWSIEVQRHCRDEEKLSEYKPIALKKLSEDKRAQDWFERIKDNSDILPGLNSVATNLNSQIKYTLSELSEVANLPLTEPGDRPEVIRYFSRENYRKRREIADLVKEQSELMQQLKSFVKYICMKDVTKIKKPFYYSHGRHQALNIRRNGKVVIGEDSWEDLHPFSSFIYEHKWLPIFLLGLGLILLTISKVFEK